MIQTLNGEYELEIVHPLDDTGKWHRLVEGYIVRAPVPASATPQVALAYKAMSEGKAIPEEIIMRLACDLLGWNSFDEEAFKQAVDHVTAVYPHTLIFHLNDGREKKLEWQNRSRAESWTPEMKEKAREAARRKYDGKNSD